MNQHKHNDSKVKKVTFGKAMKWFKSKNDIEKYGIAAIVVGGVAVIGATLFAFSQAATGPNLYVAQPSAEVTSGSTVAVTVRADSAAELINSVQASIGYDASQLQFVSLTETGPFSYVAASDTGTPGRIRIARATPTGSNPVSGDNAVVTITFKVLASSGSMAVTFDTDYSLMVRSSDNTNILTGATGATYTIASDTTPVSSATMTLSPASPSIAAGSTFTVAVKANSGTTMINSVQSTLTYDAAKLQYLSLSESDTFPNQAATDTATPGTVRVARSVQSGSGGVSGENTVVTLTFKVLASSGTTAIQIDKAGSFVVTSADNKDILATVTGSTVTVEATTSPQKTATMSMSPANGSFAQGSTVAVTVKVNSGTTPLTTVQSTFSYPATQLEYVSTTEGGVFPTAQRTRAADGVVDIIRGVQGGQAGVVGENPIVTVNFKVIGTGGAAALAFTSTSAAYDNSGTGVSILNLAGSAGAGYTITGTTVTTCTGNPSTPGLPTRTTADYTTISLSWTASNPAADCTLGGYKVLRDGKVVATVTTGASYTDTGLTAGKSYAYAVQAFDTDGHTSAVSSNATLATKADDQAPTTPAGVSATAKTAASIDLAWTASNDMPNPGGVGVGGYYIFRNNATTPTFTVTTGTTYTDTTVAANTSYSYTVVAFDKLDNSSAPSNIVTARTPSPTCSGTPSTPQALTAGTTTKTSVSFNWAASTASEGCELAGYKIYRGITLVGTVTGTSFTDSGLNANTTYSYTVQAYDTSAHASAHSAVLSVATQADTTAPVAPAELTATAVSAGRVDLSWPAGSDDIAIQRYKLYRNNTLLQTLNASQRSFSDTTVAASADYSYQISATDEAGNESTRTNATPTPVRTPAATDTQAPTAPTNLQRLAVTTSSVSISWLASTDNTAVAGYHVYRNGTLIGDSTTLNYFDTNVNADTAYTYTVKAFDAQGNVSATSNALQVQTLAQPIELTIGDLNGDKKINLYDLSILLKNWLRVDVIARSGELNGDGRVDEQDLLILLSHYGEER